MTQFTPTNPIEAALRQHLAGWHGYHEWPHETSYDELVAIHDAKHAEHDAQHEKFTKAGETQ